MDTLPLTVVPPVLEVSPASITAQLGSNLTLHCTANGFPTPIIEWVHFGMVLRERGGIEVDAEVINSTVISTLSITDVQTENYGLYTCRANTTQDSQPATVSFSGEHLLMSNSSTLISSPPCFRNCVTRRV